MGILFEPVLSDIQTYSLRETIRELSRISFEYNISIFNSYILINILVYIFLIIFLDDK